MKKDPNKSTKECNAAEVDRAQTRDLRDLRVARKANAGKRGLTLAQYKKKYGV